MKVPDKVYLRQALLRLYEVRAAVSEGGYADAELDALSEVMGWAKAFFSDSASSFADRIGVSRSVTSGVISGGRPKLENFLKCLHGLILAFEKWIEANPEVLPVFDGVPAEWRAIRGDLRGRVADVTSRMADLLTVLKQSNSIAMNDFILPQEVRQSLIAFLESALAQLRSPVVEKKFLQRLGKWLLSVGKETGTDMVEDTLKEQVTEVGSDLLDLAGEIL